MNTRTQRLPVILRLVSVCCVLALTACAQGGGIRLDKVMDTVTKLTEATTDLTEEQEAKLGEGIAANLLGAAPMFPNASIQRYVNRVGSWVAAQSERPNLKWQFAVTDDADINAFAAPGGYVFITRGLFEALRTEAELAGVLGHEIAHVVKKHHLEATKKSAAMGVGLNLLGDALGDKADRQALGKVVRAGTDLYARGLDKDDEFEADRMGVVLATRAGYNPYGLAGVLQTLQGMQAESSALALLFKTHPKPGDRLDLLASAMGTRLTNFERLPTLETRFVRESRAP